ncbi:MAG TPA: nucleoside-diphosphate kinase [Acidobacteriota bacterium]|nr:nucleoside-diphosphate kinase [Acidobacteriota bacterium]
MQRTLAIVKPDGVRQKAIGEVVKRLETAGFRMVGMKMVQLSAEQAGAFYAVHKERPFYKSLIQFMSSGPIIPMVLEAENAIERLRTLMGATDPSKAAEGTIRKDLASNVEQNVIHGSDAETTAATEIPFFFSRLELIP